MSYKYSTGWYKKRRIVVCIIIFIISLLFVISGGVLFGFLDLLKPFNVLPIAIIMIFLGVFGTLATFIFLMCSLEGI